MNSYYQHQIKTNYKKEQVLTSESIKCQECGRRPATVKCVTCLQESSKRVHESIPFKLCYNCDTHIHKSIETYHFREVLGYHEIFNALNKSNNDYLNNKIKKNNSDYVNFSDNQTTRNLSDFQNEQSNIQQPQMKQVAYDSYFSCFNKNKKIINNENSNKSSNKNLINSNINNKNKKNIINNNNNNLITSITSNNIKSVTSTQNQLVSDILYTGQAEQTQNENQRIEIQKLKQQIKIQSFIQQEIVNKKRESVSEALAVNKKKDQEIEFMQNMIQQLDDLVQTVSDENANIDNHNKQIEKQCVKYKQQLANFQQKQ